MRKFKNENSISDLHNKKQKKQRNRRYVATSQLLQTKQFDEWQKKCRL